MQFLKAHTQKAGTLVLSLPSCVITETQCLFPHLWNEVNKVCLIQLWQLNELIYLKELEWHS